MILVMLYFQVSEGSKLPHSNMEFSMDKEFLVDWDDIGRSIIWEI